MVGGTSSAYDACVEGFDKWSSWSASGSLIQVDIPAMRAQLAEDYDSIGIYVFDLNGMIVAQDLSLERVLHAYVDRLGLEGWSLCLVDQPTDEGLERQQAMESVAVKVRKQLKLPVPQSLTRG